MTCFGTDGILLPSGETVPWDQVQPGRYQIVEQLPDRWDVVFARVSTNEQVLEGCSLQQQAESAVCAGQKNGHHLAAVYIDPGKSATRLSFEKREGVRQMLEDVRRRKIRTIYVYKRDRISRTAIEWSMFLKTCATFGARLVFTCPEEPPIGQGPYGQFAEMIIIAAAELEASITRVRVKDSITNRFNNGQWIGGALPFGLRKDQDDRIVPNPAEAPIVQEIYRLAREELLGDMRIADRINAQYPGSRYGRDWGRAQVMRVLANRTYCGYFSLELEVENDGLRRRERLERFSSALPILVSEETWEQVAAMRSSRHHRRDCDPSRYRASPNLLNGLLHCGICGRPMAARHMVQRHRRKDGSVSESHHRYYFCRNGMNVRGCTYRGHAPLQQIEGLVLDVLEKELLQLADMTLMEAAKAHLNSKVRVVSEQLESVTKELHQTEAALCRNQTMLERAVDAKGIGYYEARIRDLLNQQALQLERRDAIEQRLRQGYPQITAATLRHARANWASRWEGAPPEKKRAMLSDAIKEVIWHPDDRSVNVKIQLDPSWTDTSSPVLYAE